MFPVKLPKMTHYRFKKANPPGPTHDRSFYDRFTLAWTNFQENEVESRLRLLSGDSKTRKAVRLAAREITR
jgi:hypothetical protein